MVLLDASVQSPGAGRAPVLVVRYAAGHAKSARFVDDEEHVAVLGVGASGKPSLLSPARVRKHEGDFPYGQITCQDEEETETERQWRLDGGALVVSGETVKHRLCAKKTRKQRTLAERYPLDFP